MPVRETRRIDLEKAIDNGDATISARAYPLWIYPKRSNNYTTVIIEEISVSPKTAAVEIWINSARGAVTKWSTYNGGVLPQSRGTETEPILMTLYNLSSDAEASLQFTSVSYRYNEPTP